MSEAAAWGVPRGAENRGSELELHSKQWSRRPGEGDGSRKLPEGGVSSQRDSRRGVGLPAPV